jgi:uncharacterized protein YggU (UPF0235/DUF167 family)
VAYHFMMFHVDRNVARSLGEKLGIDMTDVDIISGLASKPKTIDSKARSAQVSA